MKSKMYFTPNQDTIVICLPQDWVGKPLICTLDTVDDQEMVAQVSESSIQYQSDRFRRQASRRAPRKKRLRKLDSHSL